MAIKNFTIPTGLDVVGAITASTTITANGVTLTGNTGTVTGVSIVSANGFSGTATSTTTPAITLSTSITGLLKGNGTAISAATAGTDYIAPASTFNLGTTSITLNRASAAQTLTGISIDGNAANVTGIVAVANGGTGTASPGLIQGTNISITGTWPNQTINASASGGGVSESLAIAYSVALG